MSLAVGRIEGRPVARFDDAAVELAAGLGLEPGDVVGVDDGLRRRRRAAGDRARRGRQYGENKDDRIERHIGTDAIGPAYLFPAFVHHRDLRRSVGDSGGGPGKRDVRPPVEARFNGLIGIAGRALGSRRGKSQPAPSGPKAG